MHDLGRALKDAVDAHVAQSLLDRHGLLATRVERLGRLVAAAAAYLHELVDDGPAHLRAEQLRERGLDADVVLLVVGKTARDIQHRLEAEGARGDVGDLLGDGVERAIFRPMPSLPIRFSFGTKTSSSRVTEFSMPRNPMNWLRCSTVTPSVS